MALKLLDKASSRATKKDAFGSSRTEARQLFKRASRAAKEQLIKEGILKKNLRKSKPTHAGGSTNGRNEDG